MKRRHVWIAAVLFGLGSQGAIAQLCSENFDAVVAPALPVGWSSNVEGVGVAWLTASSSADTLPNAAFAPNVAGVGSSYLVSPATLITPTNSLVTFRHSYATEASFDGGVLEISVNGGVYRDILAAGGSFIVGGYTSTISTAFNNPIGGRPAWSGSSSGYITTAVQLPSGAIWQSVRLRWRMATDSSVAATGWRVDSILCDTANTDGYGWRYADQPYPIQIMDQATTVMSDVLYSFGGLQTTSTVAASYRYNGTQWTPIGDLPVARRYSAAVNDGTRIYILGGLDNSNATSATMYRYTPQSNTYETMAPFTSSVRGPGAVFFNGKILKVGGATNAGAMTAAAEIYNIASNTWTPIASYPIPLAFISLFARNGYVYGAGGFDSAGVATSKTYRYDPALDAWDDAPIPDLAAPRVTAAVIELPDGVLLAGGYVGGGVVSGDASASAVAWHATSNTWRAFPMLNGARARLGGGYMQGRPIVIGGHGLLGSAQPQRDVQVYDEHLFANGFE